MSASRRFGLVGALIGVATVLASAVSAAEVEQPFVRGAGGILFRHTLIDTEPRIVDTVEFAGTGGFSAQHSIIVNRRFDPVTLRGRVDGHYGATGPNNWRGEFHGIITPEGMSGTAVIERFSPQQERELTARFVGKWEAPLIPITPGPSTSISMRFTGRLIEFAPPD